MLPSAARASSPSATSSIATSSALAIRCSCSTMAPVPIVLNSNTCDRESTVSGILSSSVVAIMNTTCGGGSSIDFSRALNEWLDS